MGETSVIIGDGMIGTAIKAVQDQFAQPWLVIAAGVSDSKNVNPYDYQRESLLIERCLEESKQKNLPILYISSYSVNDEAMINSPYVKNKLSTEQIIIEASSENRILRITNAVGRGGNPSNILNYLVNAVVEKRPFHIWRDTRRNFVDVEDIARFVATLNSNSENTMELVHPITYGLPTIVKKIEDVFETKGIYTLKNSQSNHYVSNEYSDTFFRSINASRENYLICILNKYYNNKS